VFLSSVLFDCYDTQASKATYTLPDRTGTVELGMIGFVDDSNGQTNEFQEAETSSTVPSMLIQMQQNAQAWSNLLSASGGALELSKCSSHVVSWQFSSQGDPVLKSPCQVILAPVVITDAHTQSTHQMKFLSPYEAHKTLGHFKEPAGTQQSQYVQLRKKSDESTEFLWKCQLSHLEAWTYYYACYLPSIGYPLSCSALTQKQLDQVQCRAMQIIVAKCGYNRHTKKAILYGPMAYGGATFRPLYVQQGVGAGHIVLKTLAQAVGRRWVTEVRSGVDSGDRRNVILHIPQCENRLTTLGIKMAAINANVLGNNRCDSGPR
jgi:hypothetical protein